MERLSCLKAQKLHIVGSKGQTSWWEPPQAETQLAPALTPPALWAPASGLAAPEHWILAQPAPGSSLVTLLGWHSACLQLCSPHVSMGLS